MLGFAPFAAAPFSATAGVTVAISGVEATASIGDVLAGQQLNAGVEATGAVGNLTVSSTPALTSVLATGQLGSFSADKSVQLNTEDCLGWGVGPWGGDRPGSGPYTAYGNNGWGVDYWGGDQGADYYDIAWGGCQNHNPSVAYGNVGTVVAAPEIPLVGVEALGLAGTVSPSHELDPLTGVEAVGAVGTVHPVLLIPLTGVQAIGQVGQFGVIHINALTGVQAVGIVGDVCPRNWTIIDTAQTASWQAIQTAQTSSWQTIQNTQDAGWDVVVTETC